MKSELFRPSALEHIASPDLMEEPTLLVPLLDWIALAAVFLLLCAAGLWALQSTTLETIDGAGTLAIKHDSREVDMYLPSAGTQPIVAGMEARVLPMSMRLDRYGFIRGHVLEVSPAAPDQTNLTRIRIGLDSDPTTPTGLAWSASKGPSSFVSPTIACTTKIVITRKTPLSFLHAYLTRVFEKRSKRTFP